MAEFERLAGQVVTNIQKLVNNVSSMQRMVQHVDTQGTNFTTDLFFVRTHIYLYIEGPSTTRQLLQKPAVAGKNTTLPIFRFFHASDHLEFSILNYMNVSLADFLLVEARLSDITMVLGCIILGS